MTPFADAAWGYDLRKIVDMGHREKEYKYAVYFCGCLLFSHRGGNVIC